MKEKDDENKKRPYVFLLVCVCVCVRVNVSTFVCPPVWKRSGKSAEAKQKKKKSKQWLQSVLRTELYITQILLLNPSAFLSRSL